MRKVIGAQEDERKRIARRLHDDTSQALAALLYAAESGMEVDALDEVREMLEGMRDLARTTLDGVHELIFDLRPTMLNHLGLVQAVRWLAENRLASPTVRLTIQADEEVPRLAPEAETALYRAVQEAIGDPPRHALARNVHITIGRQADEISIRIEDDGVGFDVVAVSLSPDSTRGLGLAGMYERTALFGGGVDIDTAPGFGTRPPDLDAGRKPGRRVKCRQYGF